MSDLSVAVCQLTSVDDVEANFLQIQELISRLEKSPPDLICFPENSLFFRMREGTTVPSIDLDHSVIRRISGLAAKLGSAIHLGSVPLKRDGNAKMQNASVLLTPDGGVHDVYQKIHLFDVDVEGVRPNRESDTFAPGVDPSVFTVKGWKIASSICYDLRFAELYVHYAKLEVDAIVIPSAFLVPTGRAHWDVLTRARAIENQAYVLAAAQGEKHLGLQGGGRETYGHSVIVDPWGVIEAQVPSPFSENDRIIRATLSRERISKVRAQIPMKNHRCL